MSEFLKAFFLSILITTVLTYFVRFFSLKFNFVDMPDKRKIHNKPIPLLGGWAIYLTFVIVSLFNKNILGSNFIFLFTAITLLIIVGTLDDKGIIHPQVKLFIGMPVASLIVVLAGIKFAFFSLIFQNQLGNIMDILFTIFWLTGFTASFSILDHMDGLNTGVTAIASTFFLIHFLNANSYILALISIICLGFSVGFLLYNFHPAKIFLGDGGAMINGFLMGFLSLNIDTGNEFLFLKVLLPLFILVIPFLDTSLCIFSRSRRRLLPFASPGKDHISHRIVNIGFGKRGAVLLLYFTAISGGFLSLVFLKLNKTGILILLPFFIALYILIIWALEKLPYESE